MASLLFLIAVLAFSFWAIERISAHTARALRKIASQIERAHREAL